MCWGEGTANLVIELGGSRTIEGGLGKVYQGWTTCVKEDLEDLQLDFPILGLLAEVLS